MGNIIIQRLVAAFMAVVTFGTLGCGDLDGGNKEVEPGHVMKQTRLDGRSLYVGMFFGVGAGARLFPEIWEDDALKARVQRQGREAEFEAAASAMADKIAERDATFFDRFAEGIQSGNHLRIEQTMKEAQEQTRVAAVAIQGMPVEQGEGAELVVAAAPRGDLWLYVETAVAVVAVAVVLLVVIDFTRTHPEQQGHLGMDTWVDILAHKDFSVQAP